jgi:hypothetical protein
MKILVDEHIPLMTVGALRLLGHDVRDIRDTPEEGRMTPCGKWLSVKSVY